VNKHSQTTPSLRRRALWGVAPLVVGLALGAALAAGNGDSESRAPGSVRTPD